MGREKSEVIAPDIEALGQEIDIWRETRVKVGPMPENLWSKATELARRHGVTLVAQQLGLHHTRLKDRVEAYELDSVDQEAVVAVDSTFVDIGQMLPIQQPNEGDFVMDVSGADGSTMSIRMPISAAPQLSTLVESFLQQKP